MTDHGGTKNKKNGQLNKTYDAIVIGAGMSGLYQLYKLRCLGFSVLVIEAGSVSYTHLTLPTNREV